MKQNKRFTDWIPMVTPPVRDGDYQFVYTREDVIRPRIYRAEYMHGVWRTPDKMNHRLPGLNCDPENFSWRGMRKEKL